MNTTIIQLKLVHVVIFFYQIVSNTMKTKNTTRPEKYHTAEKIPHSRKNTTRPKKYHTAKKNSQGRKNRRNRGKIDTRNTHS